MNFTVLPQYKAQILQQYADNMARYPLKKGEVEAFLRDKDETFRLCLQFLYGHLPVNDVLSFPVELLAGYVEASLEAWEQIDYVKSVPQDLFFSYVLHHRVNSEWLDGSRAALLTELLPLVQGKTMEQAALAVNYWCYSQATYTPADDRTLGPLAIMRRTLGRCGEESVLAVAALRSVGIPARQCYCPRWSHCDDNHAWVEVWTDGTWHYLGACEPEPVLDKGWFTAAASRAMLVHSKRWSHFTKTENIAGATPLYDVVNGTSLYAETRRLTVQVLEQGRPLEAAEVAFQIVNYSELFTLHCGKTDAAGFTCFDTGLGDLCVSVFCKGRMLLKKVDMRGQTGVLVLELTEGLAPHALPERLAMDLTPPVGRSDVGARTEDARHAEKLRACEQRRAGYKASFPRPSGATVSDTALREAAGNWEELRAFLADARYDTEAKELLLSTLRPKDFVDITCETLFDALDAAWPARASYPGPVFRDYILAPRIADEMLLPERARIRALFPAGFAGPEEILAWMRRELQIIDDHGVNNYYPSAYGCLFYRQTPAFCFDMVFVALCRAFGLPARLAPDTKEGQWLDAQGAWRGIQTPAQEGTVALTLRNPLDRSLTYFEQFTLGRWDGRDFASLQYWGLTLGRQHTFRVRPGLYRILATTRQIDGTASVILRHVQVTQDCDIVLELPEDQTARRLKREPLALPAGPVQTALAELLGRSAILIFADPGSEPTEHLLQELLQCADGFNGMDCPLRIFVTGETALHDPTLQRVTAALRGVRTQVCKDPGAEAALHRLMQVGDLRLPFVLSVDKAGRGVYAGANYNIHMAQTLLLIQKLIEGGTIT